MINKLLFNFILCSAGVPLRCCFFAVDLRAFVPSLDPLKYFAVVGRFLRLSDRRILPYKKPGKTHRTLTFSCFHEEIPDIRAFFPGSFLFSTTFTGNRVV